MVGHRHATVASPPEMPVTHYIGGWVGPGPVWTDAKHLAPNGIRSPDLPARSESLYRLSYPGPTPIKRASAVTSKVDGTDCNGVCVGSLEILRVAGKLVFAVCRPDMAIALLVVGKGET
jgi:hypothetical protein